MCARVHTRNSKLNTLYVNKPCLHVCTACVVNTIISSSLTSCVRSHIVDYSYSHSVNTITISLCDIVKVNLQHVFFCLGSRP